MEVVRRIKDRYSWAKVILISGFGTYAIVREAILELGASYYLDKPFDAADFLMIAHWAVEKLQQ